jgi:hypothetical protein
MEKVKRNLNCCFHCVPCAADSTGVGELHACHHMAQPAHLLAAQLFLLIPLFPSLLFHTFFPNIGAISPGTQANLATVQCSSGGLMCGPTCHVKKLSSDFGNAKSSCQKSKVSHGEGHTASHFSIRNGLNSRGFLSLESVKTRFFQRSSES